MTNNTINNVPRELLADLLGNDHDKRIMAERHLLAMLANAPSPAGVYSSDPLACPGCASGCFRCASPADHVEDVRAMVAKPSPAGVDGLVRNFKTREGYDVWDKLCAIPKFGFLIGPSGGVVKVADIGNWIDRDEAQSVVDEAQCEVNLLRHEASDAQAIIDGLRGEVAEERAKVAQLEEGIPRIMEASYQFRQQRDQLAGLLREVHGKYKTGIPYSLGERIDAALSAGKEVE